MIIYDKRLNAVRVKRDKDEYLSPELYDEILENELIEEQLEEYEREHCLFVVVNNEFKEMRKALEIIKKKRVNVLLLRASENVKSYNEIMANKDFYLAQEEFDFLKEVLA